MSDGQRIDILRRFAPGTALRDAIELIMHQQTGALVVLGAGPVVEMVSTGGFGLSGTQFTAPLLAELAKMDGGIVIDDTAQLILRANVHFVPDPSIATIETGTRHRTGERLAKQTGRPVLAISEGRRMATVYVGEDRIELQSPTRLIAQANQSLNALERLGRRLTEADARLGHLEIDDGVTVRDVVVVLQRASLVRRIGDELDRFVVELGGESQLISLQAADVLDGVPDMITAVYEDYAKRRPRRPSVVFEMLDGLSDSQLYDPAETANALKLSPLDTAVRPRGLRVLAEVPRLPDSVREALVSHFGDFQKMLHAQVTELDQVEGVGSARAEQLRSYFDRLRAESGLWELID